MKTTDLPKRKPNRLHDYDYSCNGAYFVTMCTKDRAEILGRVVKSAWNADEQCIVGATALGRPFVELSNIGKIIDETIMAANHDDVIIDKYVIMPNHIHIIVVIRSETGDRGRSPLQYIIRNIKSYVSKQIGFSPWQRSYHDHIIRGRGEYAKIAYYIDHNPENWQTDCFYSQQ